MNQLLPFRLCFTTQQTTEPGRRRAVLTLVGALLLAGGPAVAQVAPAAGGAAAASVPQVITLEPGEHWWGGAVKEGHKMPFSTAPYAFNLYGDNLYNQSQPLLVSDHGRYVWSEEPFRFAFEGNKLTISEARGPVQTGSAGRTLADAYRFASRKFFPPSGKTPDPALFAQPQYNTWIELNYHHNQADVLRYAHAIIDNGLPPGVFMIDDTWQEDYGLWRFHPGRFPNPQAMMDELHRLGFKVMVWVCPFVSPDSPEYRDLRARKAFLLDRPADPAATWLTAQTQPRLVQWWNGASAVLDFTNPAAVGWFREQLTSAAKTYGIDGFKFDAGDMEFYQGNPLSFAPATPNEHCRLYSQFGLEFPLNEFRASWKTGGQPLAQRLADKNHTWADLQNLIPHMVLEGLSGYTFTCPDMIGGGEIKSFGYTDAGASADAFVANKLDQDLVVRSAQCHALMPMMQFSVAPWRILDPEHLAAVKQAVALRSRFAARIVALAQASATSGEPIVRSLEYVFPRQGYAEVNDQIMLGDKLMVAPLLVHGRGTREVVFPRGRWRADDGQVFRGPGKHTITVPLDRLPYFERQ
ncbi:glycoside hydrolase family 31 protein [Hymenobacter weizhouensis]|uniref:glycoside hydrolase family 31 protein n=1 Tax=Hymenobacter sp. YIM 151500-1 TaxID=2987689 RepID=UPI0022264840|nr:glycoside hydrolase family 31 protein [Hymenobacter sp. YIM 151500-1]UYZ62842.1 glycoside hydrolase family 31 protein [Hymenobacter sp. YIM 151500-1]